MKDGNAAAMGEVPPASPTDRSDASVGRDSGGAHAVPIGHPGWLVIALPISQSNSRPAGLLSRLAGLHRRHLI
jgi:hypothetical protein